MLGDDAKVSITQWAEVHSMMMEAMQTPAILYERPDILTEVITRLGTLTTATYMKYRMAIIAYVRWLFRTFEVVNANTRTTVPAMPLAAMRLQVEEGPLDLLDLDLTNQHNLRAFTDFVAVYEADEGPGRQPQGA
jgi:hypothetical protein